MMMRRRRKDNSVMSQSMCPLEKVSGELEALESITDLIIYIDLSSFIYGSFIFSYIHGRYLDGLDS